MSAFVVFLVRIQCECGKIQTRKTPIRTLFTQCKLLPEWWLRLCQTSVRKFFYLNKEIYPHLRCPKDRKCVSRNYFHLFCDIIYHLVDLVFFLYSFRADIKPSIYHCNVCLQLLNSCESDLVSSFVFITMVVSNLGEDAGLCRL